MIPTYNRARALRLTFPYVLALQGVREVVVVIDGSTDETEDLLRSFADPRVRVLRHQTNKGQVAARKTGIAAAQGQWLIMLDDDCGVPADFAQVLVQCALENHADIVGAPWLHLRPGADLEAALARARATRVARIRLSTHPSAFPKHDVQTPFMSANALIHRRVFDRVTHDDDLRGNAWREETSFYLEAFDAGFTCVLTPDTASFQLGQWEGGHRLPRLRYEWSAFRNNWTFLRRHADALRKWGEIRNPVTGQLSFLAQRIRIVGGGWLRARFRGRT